MAEVSFHACKVAALKHPFVPREKALLDALKDNRRPLWDELVAGAPGWPSITGMLRFRS